MITFNNLKRVPVIGDLAGVYFVYNPDDLSINGLYVKSANNIAAKKIANITELINATLENPTFVGQIKTGDTTIEADGHTIRISINGENIVWASINPEDHSLDDMEFGDRSFATSRFKGRNIEILTGNPNGEGIGTGDVHIEAKTVNIKNLNKYSTDSEAIAAGLEKDSVYVNDGVLQFLENDLDKTVNFVFQGDSRTAKLAPNGVAVEIQYPSLGVPYPNQLMLMNNFKDKGNYINTNQFGTDIAGVISSYNAKVYPYRPGTIYNDIEIKESYLILEIGVNNCTNTANIDTIKNLANSLVEYAKQAELDGFKVCLTCVIYCEDQSYSTGIDVEKNRYEFNKILKQRSKEYYMLIDLEHIFGTTTDRTLYAEYEDGIHEPILHLNGLGNYMRASYINKLFNPLNYSNFIDNGYLPKLINNNLYVTEITLAGTPILVKEYHKFIIVSGGGSNENINLFNPNTSKYNYGEIIIRRKTGGDICTINGVSIDGITTLDLPINTTVCLVWDKMQNKWFIKYVI